MVLAIVILAIVLAIGAVNIWTFEGPPLMDPEDPAVIAKRQAPENRHDDLMALAAELPKAPSSFFTRDDETYGFKGEYDAPCGSLGHMLGIDRFDDDPALHEYIAAIEAIVPEIETILVDGYVMKPTPEDFARDDINLTTHATVFQLAHKIAAAAQASAIPTGDWRTAHDNTLLALQLARAWGGDGRLSDFYYGADTQSKILSYYCEAVIAQAPIEETPLLLDAIEAESMVTTDLITHLEYEWRGYDSAYAVTYLWGSRPEEIQEQGFDTRYYVTRILAGTKKDIHERREEYMRLATGTHNEWQQWHDANEVDEYGKTVNGLGHALKAKDELAAMLKGLRIAHAIETYKRKNGDLPPALKLLDTDITDLLAPGKPPYRYIVEDNDFTLYSVGTDGHDHKAYAGVRRARDVIIHKSAAQCAKEHQEFLDRF